MMMRSASVAAIVLCLAGAAYSADPRLLGLVMPDAKLIGGVNVTEVRDSPFGRFLISRGQSDVKGFEEFTAATGFDLKRDLSEVIYASASTQPGDRTGVLLARGNFDPGRIATLVQGAGKAPEVYEGVEMLSGKLETRVLAFLDAGTAIAGHADAVRAVIDRRNSPAQLSPDLSSQIDRMSAANHVWAITLGSFAPAAGAADSKMPGDLFRSIEQAVAGVRFGTTVQLSAEAVAVTAEEATALAGALRFLTSTAAMNPPKGRSMDFAAILQGLKLSSEGNTVKLFLEMPEADLEKLFPAATPVKPVSSAAIGDSYNRVVQVSGRGGPSLP
jgi:hypothetical protein